MFFRSLVIRHHEHVFQVSSDTSSHERRIDEQNVIVEVSALGQQKPDEREQEWGHDAAEAAQHQQESQQ